MNNNESVDHARNTSLETDHEGPGVTGNFTDEFDDSLGHARGDLSVVFCTQINFHFSFRTQNFSLTL